MKVDRDIEFSEIVFSRIVSAYKKYYPNIIDRRVVCPRAGFSEPVRIDRMVKQLRFFE